MMPPLKPELTRVPQRRHRVAHGIWAALCVIVCLLLIFTGGSGHPPAVILLPLVLAMWAIGHGFLWGALRLAAAGRRARAVPDDGQPWPFSLRVAVVCTAGGALLGVIQIIGTLFAGKWYPFGQTSLWAALLLVWSLHAACFATLLLRRRAARPLSAALAVGWAALLGAQIVEHFRHGSSDTSGLLLVVAIMLSLLAFGAYLVLSSKVRSFLGG